MTELNKAEQAEVKKWLGKQVAAHEVAKPYGKCVGVQINSNVFYTTEEYKSLSRNGKTSTKRYQVDLVVQSADGRQATRDASRCVVVNNKTKQEINKEL